MKSARPALDPELQGLLSSIPETPPLNEETLEMIRPYATLPVETALAGRTVGRQEISIASFDGTQIALTILSPAGADLSPGDAPCVYWVHGGGTVMGDRYSQIDIPLDWLASFGAVVVCVDYRLAPDFPGTTLVMVDGLADRSHMRSTGVNDQPMSRRPTQLWGRVPPIGVDCAIDMARGRRSPTLLAVIRSQGLGPGLGYSGRNGSSWSSPARTTA